MINSKILSILAGFNVAGEAVPVSFVQYSGPEEAYITFQETDAYADYAEDARQVIAHNVDFDIYTRGNYGPIAAALVKVLEDAGARLVLSNCSGDLYDVKTGLYHKTLAFEFIEYV